MSRDSVGDNVRDHGGGIDAAVACFGGVRGDWIDLSTGINPVPYPIGDLGSESWNMLPDKGAESALSDAARACWNVPDGAAILAAPGASSLIATLPYLTPPGRVNIPAPTYNEHQASFDLAGWQGARSPQDIGANAKVIVHPNNPTGHWYTVADLTAEFMVIDESFADVDPAKSLIEQSGGPGRIVLKSFGKFWGLAGVRLGFAIGDPGLIGALKDRLGPWPVSGPALAIGTRALRDFSWGDTARARLLDDSARLDELMASAGANGARGTSLFRLYDVDDAAAWQAYFARAHIWTRVFPYSKTMLRLGIPAPGDWDRIDACVRGMK